MKTIVYLSYGRGFHESEVLFSLMSAWHWALPPIDGVRFAVYAEHPEVFAGLPVEVLPVDGDTWLEWSGPAGFNHRRKIMVLRDAVQRFGDRIVLVDGDTWWRKPPATLFGRIGPGESVMHIREGRVGTLRRHSPACEALATLLEGERFTGPGGESRTIDASEWMWNSGVVGIDAADAGLLDAALYWTDEFSSRRQIHILEQFSLAYVLGHHTRLSEAASYVWHYWPDFMVGPHRERFEAIAARTASLSLTERAEACFRGRPRPTLFRLAKAAARKSLESFGILPPRPRCNHW